MNLCGHVHETPEAQIACDTVQLLHRRTGGAAVVVVMGYDDRGVADPAISVVGNMTDFANIVRALLDMAAEKGRPLSCAQCQANHDALMLARGVMGRLQGSC